LSRNCKDCFGNVGGGLKRTLDPQSGRWFQVVDKGDRPDNWTDTSGSKDIRTISSALILDVLVADATRGEVLH
jgi:unsaturated rhamnogalacturonyl hydrolase